MAVPTADPGVAFERLRQASLDGRLARTARVHGLALVAVFGSVARGAPSPGDLDLAVLPGRELDVLGLLQRLYELTAFEGFDLLDLRRADADARGLALREAVPLYQERPGAFAEARMVALTQLADSAWLRKLQLEALAR